MKFFGWISTLALVFSVMAKAQVPRPGDPEYTAQGRLVILRVVPGDKTAKLFFAGRKAGEIDLKKDHKVLSITALGRGEKKEILTFQGEGEEYETTKLPGWAEPYEISVLTETRGKKEELKVKLP